MPFVNTPSPRDDADLVDTADLRASAARDRAAFERLYRRHHPRLARFLRRFTLRREVIDDVVNDTMWVVWRKAGEFRGASKVSTWITGIAYRCMLKALRDGSFASAVSDSTLSDLEVEEWADGQDDTEAQRELRDWLASGLRTLPEDQRITLELAYFLGQSCEEIALVMGCAVGTVKARMFHARLRLRNVMPALGGAKPAHPDAAKG